MKKLMVLIFNETEIKDMWGALEVFTATNENVGFEVFEAALVAETDGPILCTNGWRVIPTYTIENCPQPDILVIAGGAGAQDSMNSRALINWLKNAFEKAEILLSIGLGACLIAKTGLLDGLAATTNRADLEKLAEISSEIKIMSVDGFVDSGKIITAANYYAGIDASLNVVSKLLDPAVAQHTADYIEFEMGTSNENSQAHNRITYR
jgi:transcriptional regulator GlxA family with amidase domain